MPVEKISEADALAAHNVIHGKDDSVSTPSGLTLPVSLNSAKCRSVKFPGGVNAVEQNKAKDSEWAAKAKKGVKITWFLNGGPNPAQWGRVVAGKLETRGAAIAEAGAAPELKKRPAAAAAVAEPQAAPAPKKPKVAATPASSSSSPAPAASSATPAKVQAAPPAASGSDPLGLAAVFSGSGHGAAWEAILRPVIEAQPDAAAYIGPGRDKNIVPVRELTFQALKPNEPSGWRVVSFGQSPYPRIESATGIAHFDNALKSWEDSRFGSIVTMRCIIKAAAMQKHGLLKTSSTADLRALLKAKGTVGPAEWFQAMLTQGVLFMNAACTLVPPKDKSERSGPLVDQHRKFWLPALRAVVKAMLDDCREHGRGMVFAWWGSESLKTKKELEKAGIWAEYSGVRIDHIDSPNPAAMGDAFCNEPNVLQKINDALKKLKLPQIDWLPDESWKTKLAATSSASSSKAEEMGNFITETQDLHKMYLERLKDGLDIAGDDLADITGIADEPLMTLPEACKVLKLDAAATGSVDKAKAMKLGSMTVDEAAAIHLYTTNHLYKKLNEALRSLDRAKVKAYFPYLRLLLAALDKLPKSIKMLYRGVALDLSLQYPLGTEVTWWAVSSCTPELKVANSFSGGAKRTLFLIDASRGVGIRDLSQFKNEEEVVLAPGTTFSVAKVVTKGGVNEIHLKELSKPRRVR